MKKTKSVLTGDEQENQSPRFRYVRSSVAFAIVFWCAVGVFMCGMCYLLEVVDLTARITHILGA